MVIRNRLEELSKVQRRFAGFARRHGIPEPTADRFRIALDEVLNNVIRHALPQGEERSIEVRWGIGGGALAVKVTDDGEEFDPLRLPMPDITLPLEARGIGGLGIHIVRTLMDEVRYERSEGRNVLTMIRRIDATAGGR